MKKVLLCVLLICLTALPPVLAGSRVDAGSLAPEQAALVGKRLEQALARRGARVAIVARVGRAPDRLPPGIRYTHVAYAVYSNIRLADGNEVSGYTFYNLYQDTERPDRSSLVQDYASDFFMGAVVEDTGVLIPKPEVQRRLLRLIASPAYARLHNPRYSVIANPYDLARQNCTEMVLDVLQAALYTGEDRAQLKVNLAAYFEAQAVALSPFQILVGSLVAPDVTVADHRGQPIRTATFGSLGRYMARYGLLEDGFEIGPDGSFSPVDQGG